MAALDLSKYGARPINQKKFDPSQYGARPLSAEKNESSIFDTGLETAKNAVGNLFPGLRASMIGGQDIVEKGVPALVKGVQAAPSESLGMLKQILSGDPRFSQNIAAGTGELEKSFVNTPASMVQLAKHLKLLPASVEGEVPRQTRNYLDELLGPKGPVQPGDVLSRALPQLLPFAGQAPKAAALAAEAPAVISKGASYALGTKNPLLVMQQKMLESKVGKLGEEKENLYQAHETKKQAYQNQLEEHNKAVEQAKEQVNMSDAARMKFKLQQHNERLGEAQQESERIGKELEQMPPPPNQPQFGNEHIQNAENAAAEVNRAQEGVEKAKQHHENISNLLNESEGNISEHLKLGETHHLHVGRYLNKEIKNIFESAKEEYGKLINDVKDTQYKMPNLPAFQTDIEHVLRQLRAGADPRKLKNESLDNPELKELIGKAPTSKDVTASDFITKYRDFGTAIHEAKQRMKATSSAEERNNLAVAIKEANKVREIAKKTLEEGLGRRDAKRFENVNNTYSKVVYPLKENPIARKVLKSSKMTKGNMIEQLTGENPGHDTLRALINKNPEMVKHIVGERYEVNPTEVYQPNEAMRQFTDQLPELQKMVENRNEESAAIEKAKGHIALAKKQHEVAKENATEASKKSVQVERENTRLEKAHEKAVKEHENKKAAMQKQIDDYHAEIKHLNEEIPKLEKQMHAVRKEADNTKLTLKEKLAAERKYKEVVKAHKDAKKQLAETNRKLDKSATGLRYLVNSGLKLAKKAIKGAF